MAPGSSGPPAAEDGGRGAPRRQGGGGRERVPLAEVEGDEARQHLQRQGLAGAADHEGGEVEGGA